MAQFHNNRILHCRFGRINQCSRMDGTAIEYIYGDLNFHSLLECFIAIFRLFGVE